jgi:hypothetical protein
VFALRLASVALTAFWIIISITPLIRLSFAITCEGFLGISFVSSNFIPCKCSLLLLMLAAKLVDNLLVNKV